MQAADLDVLIVDDHEGMRALLTRVLEKAGVSKLRAAASGEEALALLGVRSADLILADRSMPGMDGTDFVTAVRSDAAFGAPRIIMISGHGGGAEASLAAGADAFLVKPVSPRDLLAAIERLFAV